MVDKDQNSTGNPQPSNGHSPAHADDATLFDDLTVLSRGQGLGDTNRTDNLGAVPERVDDTGNENVQADVNGTDARERQQADSGAATQAATPALTLACSHNVPLVRLTRSSSTMGFWLRKTLPEMPRP